jgi:phosphatidylserine decarboxylase
MMTSFYLGGSDLVMLFQRQGKLTVTARMGTHYPVRSQLASSAIPELLL